MSTSTNEDIARTMARGNAGEVLNYIDDEGHHLSPELRQRIIDKFVRVAELAYLLAKDRKVGENNE